MLSDLPDAHVSIKQTPTDFSEGMSMIYDALHPWVDDTNGDNGNNHHRSNRYRQRSIAKAQ